MTNEIHLLIGFILIVIGMIYYVFNSFNYNLYEMLGGAAIVGAGVVLCIEGIVGVLT